nr:MAG TPA: hypothetical protein [Caudoviricetes sp.]
MARQLRQLKLTTKRLAKGSFPLQPSISKAIPLAGRADRRQELA